MTDISVLTGKTLTAVTLNGDVDEIDFVCADGSEFKMVHYQDCCESVRVEEVIGDFYDLLDTPILLAEEVSNEAPQDTEATAGDKSFTWTFYRLRTIKGSVDIRWYGTSNGFYSETVDFKQTKKAA